MSKKIGYIRVSTLGQNLGRQLDGLTRDKVFIEHASGKDTHRPQLALLLDYVRDGDQVFVHSMARLARNLEDLISIVLQLNSEKVPIQFLQENLRFNDENPCFLRNNAFCCNNR